MVCQKWSCGPRFEVLHMMRLFMEFWRTLSNLREHELCIASISVIKPIRIYWIDSVGVFYIDINTSLIWPNFSSSLVISDLIIHNLFTFKKNLFSVRLLSVRRGHLGFSSPPQRPMISDFEGFSIPDFIHYIYLSILILETGPVFPFFNVQCWTRELLVPFYNVFGMTRCLTGGLNPGPPVLEASTIPLGYREGGWQWID